jgi:hypothetical protein
MKIWRFFAGFLLAICACLPADAQQTKAQLNAQNNTVIVPNGVGGITASNLHPILQNMINSSCTIADPTNCPISALSGATIANGPLIGAPSGGGVAQGTRSGTTAVFPVIDGTSTNGQCAVFDANGGFTSQACTGSGSGTVGSGLVNQFAYYNATGSSVVGLGLNSPLLGPNVNNVVANGADPTGAADSTAAFNSAITAALAGPTGGGIMAPCGRYEIAGQVVAAIPAAKSFSMFGGGADCTTIFTPTGSPISLTLGDGVSSSFHLRDFSVTTQAQNVGTAIAVSTSHSGIQENSAANDITNVTIRGDDAVSGASPFHADFFGTDIGISGGVSTINFTNVNDPGNASVLGFGVSLTGDSTNSRFGIVYNFQYCSFYFDNAGIIYGSWIQGVQIENSNFTGSNVGVLVNGTSGGLFQLSVTNSQFNTKVSNIETDVPLSLLNATGNVFTMDANSALGIDGIFVGATITGNTFINAGGFTDTNGVVTQSGSNVVQVTGNTFQGLSTGIFFQTGTTNASAQSNTYTGFVNKTSPTVTTGTVIIGGGSS